VLARWPWRALLILLGCVGLLLAGLVLVLDWDRLRVAAERSRRLAYAAAGARLPGTPDLDAFDRRLAALGVEPGAPVFIRIFKLEFHVHVFPFLMTEERLVQRRHARWAGFWRDLKPGYDTFEATQQPPRISVCQGRYAVSPALPGSNGDFPIDNACPEATGTKS
jgi:hypothetical protein